MFIREAGRTAVQLALVTLGSYVLGSTFTSLFHAASAGTGGLWAVMSGSVVLQSTRRETLYSAWLQILGTFVGAVVSAAFLVSVPFSPAWMAVAIALAVLLCHAAHIPEHARLAALAVGVVMVVSNLHPALHPVINSALRFAEACIGAAVAVLVDLIWPQSKAPRHVAVS